MTEKQACIQLLIEAIAATATFLAVVVAIWGDGLRRSWAGPKLRLRLLDPTGEPIPLSTGQAARYYHVEIRNARPSAIGTNVRVYVTKIRRPRADGQFTPTELADVLSGGVPLTRQHGHTMPANATVGPQANYDLATIAEGSPSVGLQLVFVPNNANPRIGKDERVQLELVAWGDQGKSPPLHVEIAWDGAWDNDTALMARHLVVKVIPQLR